MRKQITKFSLHQSSKVHAIIFFLISTVIVVPVSIISFLMTQEASSFAMLILPILYLVGTYIGTIIFLFVYNLVAKSFGGIEFEFTDVGGE